MSTPEPIADLRARLLEAQEAAARLAGEAQRAAAGDGPPAQGWATPQDGAARQEEVEALVALVRTLAELVPDELRDDVRELLRQLLVVLRALVDWLVLRLEADAAAADRTPAGPGRVAEDIPVD